MQTTTQQSDSTLFEAKTRDVVDVKRLARALAATVTDTPVTISEDGLRFLAADAAMVAMIDLTLHPALFDRWQPPAKAVTFGLNADEFKDKVGEAKQGDELTLSVTEERVDGSVKPVLHITIYRDGIRTTMSLPSLALDEDDQPETDDLEFAGEALVALDPLRDAIKNLGDSIQFTLDEEGLTLTSADAEAGSRVAFPANSDHIHAINLNNGPVSSRYAQDYLDAIRKLKHTVDRVTVRFGTDFPLQVSVDQDRFHMVYTLAPRIEE